MQVQPYLMFDGRCEEAVEFYRKALGAKVEALLRFKDRPESQAACVGATPDKIMHTCLRIGDTAVMASDGQCQGQPRFQGFSLSITAADDEDAKRRFAALAEAFFSQVDGLVAKAAANGGKAVREPQDHGFMYQHAFEDPDGHIWELVHMRSQP